MVAEKVIVKNTSGLHMRPASVLCKTAMQFHSLITFKKENCTVNAKSVLSVLSACVKKGDEIQLVCEGEDEREALETLVEAIKSGLEEDIV